MSDETTNQNLPANWQTKELGEVTDIIYGVQAAVAQNLDSSIGLPILTNINITNEGKVNLDKLRYYDLPQKKREALILKKGDLLFNWRSGSQDHVGKTALFNLDGDFTFSSFILRLRTNEKIFNEFLHFYLYFIKANGFFSSKRRQSSINSVFNASVAAKTPIAFPPLPEQKAIAKVLRSVQEAKEARQTELRLERERKNALMDYLFTHGTRGESLKQTEIGEMPESWEVVRLGEMITLQRGKDLPIQDRVKGDIPIVGSNGIVGFHNQTANMPIPCVATGRSGSIGLITYVDKPYWALNTALYVSDYKGNYPLFIYYWLHLFDFKRYAEGASVPTLNRNKVHPVKFRLPTIEEQKEIAEVLQACDEKISSLENEINLLNEFFKAVLEELMSGKLSSKNLTE